MKYDIYNPTPAARVIYDGIPKDGKPGGPQGQYHFPPGSRRDGVELSDDIAADLISRTKGEGKHDADLRLTPSRTADESAALKQNDSTGRVTDQAMRRTK